MSDVAFLRCLAFTLAKEGGWVNDPRDPGGATNCGITIGTLSECLGRRATLTELRALSPTSTAVMQIYKTRYWQKVGGDTLPAGVDLMAFDIGVNSGVGTALDFLRQTASLPAYTRIKKLDELRCGFWRHLRKFPVFGKGWLARETACLALAQKMLAHP